jgi:hypothetical protein
MLEVQVQPAEFYRLLGYPRGKQPDGRAAELAAWVRDWYRAHGRPWIHKHEEGHEFLVAVSAGPELEEEAQRRWRDSLPDEYFFLETYGSAVVEHLTTKAGAQLCEWADPHGLAILPHRSPGYPGCDIAEQAPLLERMRPLPYPLDVLPSGMLRPKKSQISVFPVVPKTPDITPLNSLVPCTHCTFTPCQYRRVQFRVNTKALRRWAAERLRISRRADGAIEARFQYEGTTCTNLGRPLRFEYRVTLGPRQQGYPIEAMDCSPTDEGYKHMCRYIEDPVELMQAIAMEKPMLGQPLHYAVSAPRPESFAGCHCVEDSRAHKWGLVFETIYYRLANDQAISTQ